MQMTNEGKNEIYNNCIMEKYNYVHIDMKINSLIELIAQSTYTILYQSKIGFYFLQLYA